MISLSKFKQQYKLSDFEETDSLDSNSTTAGFYISKIALKKDDEKYYWLKFPTNDRTSITRLTKEVKFYQNLQEKLVHKNLLDFQGIIPKIDQTPELNPFYSYTSEIGKIVIHVPVFTITPFSRCSDLRASLNNKITSENLPVLLGCCRYIATQIFEAFKYCHQNEIYIVSLKPDTVAITKEGGVLITDFTESASSSTGQLCFFVTDPVRFGEKGNRPIEIDLAENESQFAFDAKHYDMFTLGTFIFFLVFGVPFYKNDEDEIYQKLIDKKFDEFWIAKLERVAKECPYFDLLMKEEETLLKIKNLIRLLLLREADKDEDKDKILSWMTSDFPSSESFVDFFFQCSKFSTDSKKPAVNISPLQNHKLNCPKKVCLEGLVTLETQGKWKIIDAKDIENQFTMEYKSESEKVLASFEARFLSDDENSVTLRFFRISGSWYEYLEAVHKFLTNFEKSK